LPKEAADAAAPAKVRRGRSSKKAALADTQPDLEELPHPSELPILRRPGPLIRRLHQISVSIFLTHAREFDLTPVQYGSLQLVEMFPGVHQAALGKLLALDRQTISNVVQRLCDKRLLDRREKDARTSALFTTGAGVALIKVMQDRLGIVDDMILGPLSSEERAIFMDLLLKLVESNNELSRAPSGGALPKEPGRPKQQG